MLGGRYRHGTPKDSRGGSDRLSWFVQPYLTRKSNAVVEAIVKAADGLGATVPQIALAWVRDAPVVASALVGPRTTSQLEELLGADESVFLRRSPQPSTTSPAGQTSPAKKPKSNSSALAAWHPRSRYRTIVELARTGNPRCRILKNLLPVGNPTSHPPDSEHDSKHVQRDAERA